MASARVGTKGCERSTGISMILPGGGTGGWAISVVSDCLMVDDRL